MPAPSTVRDRVPRAPFLCRCRLLPAFPVALDSPLDTILAFLERIGVAHQAAELPQDTFLPGIAIEGGRLLIDRARLEHPGDALHEAGHIALTPSSERSTLNQAVLGRRLPQESEEIGVLLWTYLAAKEIGLPVEVVFHSGGYKGGSGWLIEQFEGGTLIGLPLLKWMGIVETDAAGGLRVKAWLRA